MPKLGIVLIQNNPKFTRAQMWALQLCPYCGTGCAWTPRSQSWHLFGGGEQPVWKK